MEKTQPDTTKIVPQANSERKKNFQDKQEDLKGETSSTDHTTSEKKKNMRIGGGRRGLGGGHCLKNFFWWVWGRFGGKKQEFGRVA